MKIKLRVEIDDDGGLDCKLIRYNDRKKLDESFNDSIVMRGQLYAELMHFLLAAQHDGNSPHVNAILEK